METNIMISNHNKHLWPCRHSEQVIETIHIVCKFFLTAPEALIKQIPYRKKKWYNTVFLQHDVQLHVSISRRHLTVFILDAISTAEFMGAAWDMIVQLWMMNHMWKWFLDILSYIPAFSCRSWGKISELHRIADTMPGFNLGTCHTKVRCITVVLIHVKPLTLTKCYNTAVSIHVSLSEGSNFWICMGDFTGSSSVHPSKYMDNNLQLALHYKFTAFHLLIYNQ